MVLPDATERLRGLFDASQVELDLVHYGDLEAALGEAGDMGIVDGQRILFVGREGDIIKTADSNVSPAEVEMEMQRLDGVHSAYVVGIPDEERGQLLVAAVVPRDGAQLDTDALREQLQERLSGYKVPRAYLVLQREEVPLLHSNKVARREIADLIARRLGRADDPPA